jgi:DNA-3-methyladenine glycosylase I
MKRLVLVSGFVFGYRPSATAFLGTASRLFLATTTPKNRFIASGVLTKTFLEGYRPLSRISGIHQTIILCVGSNSNNKSMSNTTAATTKRKSTRLAAKDTNNAATKKQKLAKADKKSEKQSLPSSPPWFTVFTKDDEQYTEYMTTEWGVEQRGDDAMFEKLSLEGAQAGLSWLTILRKRHAYRKTFYNFDVDQVARMTPEDVQTILDTPKSTPSTDVVVKHRGKIEAVIHNAKCIQKMRDETEGKSKYGHGVFDDFLWSFIDNQPIVNNAWDGKNLTDCPSTSPESIAMSKALRGKGFKFVGPTTCHSMMQAYGMVMDHPPGCPEYDEALERLRKRPGGYQTRGNKTSL